MAADKQRGGEEDAPSRVALLHADVRKEEWRAAAAGTGSLGRRVWEESRKLWVIVAPAIFSRVVTYSMNVITQAFAGHLGDLELAAISIANTVVVGFNFGLMVRAPPPPPLPAYLPNPMQASRAGSFNFATLLFSAAGLPKNTVSISLPFPLNEILYIVTFTEKKLLFRKRQPHSVCFPNY